MLELVIIVLVVMWLLGFFVIKVGALIHILLVVAVIAVLLRVIRGR